MSSFFLENKQAFNHQTVRAELLIILVTKIS